MKLRELLVWSPKIRILHQTWLAFFISFMVWFNHAPLLPAIKAELALTDAEVNGLLLLNFALPIPARIVFGMIVDRFGAKLSYSVLLALGSAPCFVFAAADSFAELAWARFFLGFIGAGFVIGIRIIGDWFPARQLGLAEGVYGGFGNFGAAAAALSLPALALAFGGDQGWRWAVAVTGVLALVYAVVYYRGVEDTPPGMPYLKPKRSGALEVSSIRDLFFYLVATAPLYGALSLLTWKLSRPEIALLPPVWEVLIHGLIGLLFLLQAWRIVEVNADRLTRPVAGIQRYAFRQVALLSVAYLMTFGSKLAVMSMLPMYLFTLYQDSAALSLVEAGFLASGFMVMNLIARPAGGWLSDRIGRRRTLVLAMIGTALGYGAMALIDGRWPLLWTVTVIVGCSLFIQAAEGAVFAIAPMIRRPMTGQIAGFVGAYGNAGAILFMVLLTWVSPGLFFLSLSLLALGVTWLLGRLEEPRQSMVEILPDGTALRIELD